MGVFDHSRSRRVISTPSRSGRPRSRRIEVRGAGRGFDEALLAGDRFDQAVALGGQRRPQEAHDLRLVLHHQDDLGEPAAASGRSGALTVVLGRRRRAPRAGSSKRKTAPRGLRFRAQIRPRGPSRWPGDRTGPGRSPAGVEPPR